MRVQALASMALLALLAAPTAQACSLAYAPFAQARFEGGDLWYTDGATLRHVSGAQERTPATGFFLSHAHDADGRLLVGGQEGLGADCSGDAWLELRDADRVVWRRPEGGIGTRVFDHPAGPFVESGDHYFRLDGEELVPHGRAPKDTWTLAWTEDGRPVFQQEREVRVGDRVFSLAPDGRAAAAASHAATIAVVQELTSQVRLHLLEGDQVRNVTWETGEDRWQMNVVRAGPAWLVLAGGRAYRVGERDVQDLGVAQAVAIAARGDSPVVFTEEGYTVFAGSKASEAWMRSQDGTWTAVPPKVGPHKMVHPVFDPGGRVATTSATESGDGRTGSEPGVLEVPSVSVGIAALALAAAARRRH